MVKIFKKNQIVFMTLGLMLIVAGYLNYTYNPELRYQTELTGRIDEGLGDTIYVNTLPVDTSLQTNTNVSSSDNQENINTQTNIVKDEYFTQTKIDRDKMFDKQIDSYKEIIENANISEEQKNNAQDEIKKINQLKNNIMIAENLILLKEVDNVVIMTNGKSVNVIVKSKQELDKDKVAQIYSIVTRELSVDMNNIQILLKKD